MYESLKHNNEEPISRLKFSQCQLNRISAFYRRATGKSKTDVPNLQASTHRQMTWREQAEAMGVDIDDDTDSESEGFDPDYEDYKWDGYSYHFSSNPHGHLFLLILVQSGHRSFLQQLVSNNPLIARAKIRHSRWIPRFGDVMCIQFYSLPTRQNIWDFLFEIDDNVTANWQEDYALPPPQDTRWKSYGAQQFGPMARNWAPTEFYGYDCVRGSTPPRLGVQLTPRDRADLNNGIIQKLATELRDHMLTDPTWTWSFKDILVSIIKNEVLLQLVFSDADNGDVLTNNTSMHQIWEKLDDNESLLKHWRDIKMVYVCSRRRAQSFKEYIN